MLRPANPISYGSACMMSNVLSGGIAFIALRSGSHAESVVGMTLVTPEGDILKTGSSAIPQVGDVPVLGPGPGIWGMFLAAEGNFGICTEMTLQLYTENPWPRDKTLFLNPVDGKEEGMEDVAEFFYTVSRDNYTQAFYKASNRHLAQMGASSEQEITAVIESLPAHSLWCVLTGLDEEEIEIKKRHLGAQLKANGKFVEVPESEKKLLFETMNMTEEEANRVFFKRCYTAVGRVGRWKGSFQWTTHAVKMEKIAELEKKYRAIMNRYWISPDYYGSSLATTTDTALQGPYQYGRTVMLEFDFYYDQGNPDEVKRANVVVEKLHRMMLDSGTIALKVGQRTLELQIPRLGTYFDLCKRLKRTFDPNGIMSPDTMPIMDDYL
jgi:FAD/FMN-containing dehydrogenase